MPHFYLFVLLSLSLCLQHVVASPPLPSGLSPSVPVAPALPTGLFKTPPLPAGIEPTQNSNYSFSSLKEPFFDLSGFWDIRSGFRTQGDSHQQQKSINEARLHLAFQTELDTFTFTLNTDVIYDETNSQRAINLDKGQGWVDLRQANVAWSPFSFMDIKIGRQILTWGTGDLIFINDLFPKDWQAFFIGRDLEYLKAPSDAIKGSFFTDYANLDIVYTPRFDTDRSITGEKLSYYSPLTNSLQGEHQLIKADRPHSDELALRLYKNIGVNELALYTYHGYWKSPMAYQPSTNKNRYPVMRSLGASLRRPLWKGISNVELGYYDAYEHAAKDNPFTPNSEVRLLLGYEQELIKNLTLSFQYYLEWMQDYKHYKASMLSIGATHKRHEFRHVLTNRISVLTHQQNINWSLFTFYSPSDSDAYIRPNIHYKINDHWAIETGGNIFIGKQYRFFGQFKKNNNLYAAIRYGF